MLTLISSQRFLDDAIVLTKMALPERWIHISPPFMHKGKIKAVLMDGHHSLMASIRLGELPLLDLVDGDEETELLYQGEIDWFLEINKNDSEWYEIFCIDGDFEPVNIWDY